MFLFSCIDCRRRVVPIATIDCLTYCFVSAVSPAVEQMIARSNRLEVDNDSLRQENLDLSKRVLILDRTVGKLREQRMVHLLKEQDFLDLEQEVKLKKEIGAANKKCSRMRHLHRYVCKVIVRPRYFEEDLVMGMNDTIRARKIRRLKLQRNIEIEEYHHLRWTTPDESEITDPEETGGDNPTKKRKRRTKKKSTPRSPALTKKDKAKRKELADARDYLAEHTAPTTSTLFSGVQTEGSRPSSPVLSIQRNTHPELNKQQDTTNVQNNQEQTAGTVAEGAGDVATTSANPNVSLDDAIEALVEDPATKDLVEDLLNDSLRSTNSSEGELSGDANAFSTVSSTRPKRKYNKLLL